MKSQLRLVTLLALLALPCQAATVLMYGDSVREDEPNEATVAADEGHTVTVVTPEEWGEMTTLQFAAFDLIVIGDNGCDDGDFTEVLGPVADNRAVWSPAITGNVVLHTFDSFAHFEGREAAIKLVANGVNWAASGGGTGLYVSTGCYAQEDGDIDFMAEFGTFSFIDDSADLITVTGTGHPLLDGLDDDNLSGWGSSVHLLLTEIPDDFTLLAVAEEGEGEGASADLVVPNGAIVVRATIVPTLPPAGLAAFAAFLALAGARAVNRRRATAAEIDPGAAPQP